MLALRRSTLKVFASWTLALHGPTLESMLSVSCNALLSKAQVNSQHHDAASSTSLHIPRNYRFRIIEWSIAHLLVWDIYKNRESVSLVSVILDGKTSWPDSALAVLIIRCLRRNPAYISSTSIFPVPNYITRPPHNKEQQTRRLLNVANSLVGL
jgi:hypothetical protein